MSPQGAGSIGRGYRSKRLGLNSLADMPKSQCIFDSDSKHRAAFVTANRRKMASFCRAASVVPRQPLQRRRPIALERRPVHQRDRRRLQRGQPA